MATAEQRKKMGRAILDFEARRDAHGRLAVYDLPSADGGGTHEVAGINERYHPEELSILITMLRAGKYDEAEAYAMNFFLTYSGIVTTWQSEMDPGVEFFLRDSVVNRGPTGAARILQIALGTDVDGRVGSITRGALATAEPGELLDKLREARERYERVYAHRAEGNKFWRGLVNRWDDALALSTGLQEVVA